MRRERSKMAYTLEQIEEVCKAATKGPWVRQDTQDYGEIYKLPIKALSKPLALVANEYNADFIAIARTALPELAQRVIELEARWQRFAKAGYGGDE